MQTEQLENTPNSVFRKLRVYNFVMGIFHLIQSFLMFALSNDFKLPLTNSYLTFNAITKSLDTATNQVALVKIGPLVASFLLVSAIAHFLLSSPGIYNWYVKNLKRKINYARWWEYAISSSLMIIVIAMLNGIYGIGILIAMFSLNAIMNMCGLMMEIHNQTTLKTNWTSFYIGCFAGAIPWVIMAIYFVSAAVQVENAIPTFVYWILASLFIFFNIFALNMYLQYKQVGPWKNYLFGERVYILLSLIAKTLLAWQVFAGTLRPM